jgi:hypothetical protein
VASTIDGARWRGQHDLYKSISVFFIKVFQYFFSRNEILSLQIQSQQRKQTGKERNAVAESNRGA